MRRKSYQKWIATPLASEAKIASPVAKPALRAIEGGAPKTAPAAEDPRTRRRRIIGIAVGAFAIAAAALLMVYGPPTPEVETVAEATPEAALDEPRADVPPTTVPLPSNPGTTGRGFFTSYRLRRKEDRSG